MIPRELRQAEQQSWRPLRALLGWNTLLPRPSGALQWGAVLAAGLLLGAVGLAASLLSPRLAVMLVVVALSPLVAIVIGNLKRVLLAILLLDLPLQLDVYMGYRDEIGNLGGVGGWSISLTTVVIVALYLLWLSGLLARTAPQPRLALGAMPGLLLFLVLAAFSLLVARDRMLATFSLLLWAQMFLVFLYIVSTTRSREDLLFIVTMLLAGLALESGIILLQRVAGVNVAAVVADRTQIGGGVGFAGRATGTLATPNNAASYLGQTMILAAGVLLSTAGRWRKRLAALAFGLGAAALFLTFSRGGWLAFAIAMLVLALPALVRGRVPPLLPLAVVLVVTPLTVIFQEFILSRLAQGDNGRSPLIDMALAIIRDHPLLGVGANNYVLYIPEYATPAYGGVWLYAVHNTYLLLWAELGPLALISIVLFLALGFTRGWRCWRSGDPVLGPLGLGMAAAIVAFMVHMQFDLFNGRGLWELILVNVALVTALDRIRRHEQAAAPAPREPGAGRRPYGSE